MRCATLTDGRAPLYVARQSRPRPAHCAMHALPSLVLFVFGPGALGDHDQVVAELRLHRTLNLSHGCAPTHLVEDTVCMRIELQCPAMG